MKRPAANLVAAVLMLTLGAVAAGGCGFGPGKSSAGEANLRVTREFGTEQLVEATLTDPTESDNVVRFLDQNADVETSYGGNFVDSIDGYTGSTSGGGAEDWFFFVNGYYSDVGAGETPVRPGDRIWWDYRYWAAAYRVPAVVGSWPEPFLSGYQGKHFDTVVECLAATADCDAVIKALEGAGVEPRLESVSKPVEHPDKLRVLVGPWDALRSDRAAAQIESGPGSSGVYADLNQCGSAWQLSIDDSHGDPVQTLTSAGFVAAARNGQDQPTWVVAGTDDESVADAAGLLDSESLNDRYAVAAADGQMLPMPAADDAGSDRAGPVQSQAGQSQAGCT